MVSLKSIFYVSLLGASVWTSNLLAQDAQPNIDNQALYKKALQARDDGLVEIAIQGFEKLDQNAQSQGLTQQRQIYIKELIELYLRLPDLDKAKSILELLDKTTPEYAYWQGQVYARQGLFTKALASFAIAQSKSDQLDSRLIPTLLMSQVSLLLAIGDTQQVEPLLNKVIELKQEPMYSKAQLWQAQLWLEEGKVDTLKNWFETELNQLNGLPLYQAKLIQAQLFLLDGQALKASDLVESILSKTLPAPVKIEAYLTQIDAQISLARIQPAIENLVSLLDQFPESSQLEDTFERLFNLLPEAGIINQDLQVKIWQWLELPEILNLDIQQDLTAAVIANPYPQNHTFNHSERQAQALFFLARLLERSGDVASFDKARQLLSLLRWYHPSHFLYVKTLLLEATWCLKRELFDEAKDSYYFIASSALSMDLKSQGLLGQAATYWNQKNYEAAEKLFKEASLILDGKEKQKAIYQSAVARMLQVGIVFDDTVDFEQEDEQWRWELEKALYATSNNAFEAKELLVKFLNRYPNQPRSHEALLAIIYHTLEQNQLNLDLASQYLEDLQVLAKNNEELNKEYNLLRFRYLELAGYTDQLLVELKAFLENNTLDKKQQSLLEFKLAQYYYQSGFYLKALVLFNQCLDNAPQKDIKQMARFFAAQSARKIYTVQEQVLAKKLFVQIHMDKDHLLWEQASLALAQIYLDEEDFESIRTVLQQILSENQVDYEFKVDALKLLTALFENNNFDSSLEKSNQTHLQGIIANYDELLNSPGLPFEYYAQLHYLKGLIYERADKESLALDSYYAVFTQLFLLEGSKSLSMKSWYWYELCSFNIIRLLENNENWEAAYRIAKRLAKVQGPRATEAQKKAKDLQLQHLIWDEDFIDDKTNQANAAS